MTTTRARRARAAIAATVVAALVGPLAAVTGPPVGALTPAADDAWVGEAYRVVLDRAPTTAQRQHRVAQLQGGSSRRAVADQLVASAEHAGLVVDGLYRRVMLRPIDGGGRTFWVGRLTAGDRVTTVASFFYGSPETYERGGGTAEGWVRYLYADVLGRTAGAGEASYWVGRLESGEVRTRVARTLLLTPEAADLRAEVLFRDVLGRPPTAVERTTWSGHLRRVDDRRALAALLATAAFQARAGSDDRSTVIAAGNGDSTLPSVSADGRIVAFTSTASNLTGGASAPGDDVFVYDRVTGRLTAITSGNDRSTSPQVSADGSTVVFQSQATNLVAGDTNGQVDIFRASTRGGPITVVAAGNGPSTDATVSGDGSVVAYSSTATDLVASDPNGGISDVYVETGLSEPLRYGGEAGSLAPSTSPDLAASGWHLTFNRGSAAHIAALPDPHVEASYDRPLVTDPPSTLSGRPTISSDGATVVITQFTPVGPSYLSRVLLLSVDELGTVTDQQPIGSWYKPQNAQVSDDGTAVLIDVPGFEVPAGTYLALRSGEPPEEDGPFGSTGGGTDLTVDGGLVVESRAIAGQPSAIVLHETR